MEFISEVSVPLVQGKGKGYDTNTYTQTSFLLITSFRIFNYKYQNNLILYIIDQ